MKEFLGIILMTGFGAAAGFAMLLLSKLFGPKKPTAVKCQPFECGMPPAEPPKSSAAVNFYLTAVIFVMFDVEIIFFYPWAISFRELGVRGFEIMAGFIIVLFIALFYAAKRGALEWD